MQQRKLKYLDTIEHYIDRAEYWLKLFIYKRSTTRKIFVEHYIDLAKFFINLQKKELKNDIGSEQNNQ